MSASKDKRMESVDPIETYTCETKKDIILENEKIKITYKTMLKLIILMMSKVKKKSTLASNSWSAI